MNNKAVIYARVSSVGGVLNDKPEVFLAFTGLISKTE